MFGVVATVTLLVAGRYIYIATPDHGDPAVPSTSSLSTPQLLQLSRTENVCQELLRRDGLDVTTRKACLLRLAAIWQQSVPESLRILILSLPRDAAVVQQRNLCHLAAELSPEDAGRLAIQLRETDGPTPTSTARVVSLAVLLTVETPIDDEHIQQAASSRQPIRNQFLQSMTLMPTASARRRVYQALRGLLLSADEDQKTKPQQTITDVDGLKNAMAALCRVSTNEQTTAVDLVRLADNPRLRKQAMDALATIPAKSWPPDKLGHIAAHCVAIIAQMNADERTSDESASVLRVVQVARQRMSGHKATRLTSRLHQLLPPPNQQLAVDDANVIQNAGNTGGAQNEERTAEHK